MNTTRSNYRVEIKLDPRQTYSEMPHEWFVDAWLEIAEEIGKRTGIKAARVGLAWDVSHQCEACGSELELVGDQTKCVHCERFMCNLCNCGRHNSHICETCWEDGKR